MNVAKRAVVAGVAAVGLSGGLASAGSGSAIATTVERETTRDVVTAKGECSREASYDYRIADAGRRLNLVRLSFAVDSSRDDRRWKVKVYANGKEIRDLAKTTNDQGNYRYTTRFNADDDTRISVWTRSSYLDRCEVTRRLDS